jgi:hypothetical protein
MLVRSLTHVGGAEWATNRVLAIEAEARADALAQVEAVIRDAKFPRQYTFSEGVPAHETFLLGAQEIQAVILREVRAILAERQP